MGRVFYGMTDDYEPVAVKVIRDDLAGRAEVRARFAREMDALRTVQSPYVAALVDASGEDEERPWLAVEYVRGLSLKEFVETRGPLGADNAATLGMLLAGALEDIHEAGLVHRDLKPGNILLGRDGPKVIDLGLVAFAEGPTDLTRTDSAIGTPACMSPEQAGRPKEVTAATDVYALGATLVAVLTVAVHRGWVAATVATGLHLVAAVPFGYENPPPGVTPWAYVTIIVLMYLTPLGFGMAVRARRQLMTDRQQAAEHERVERERAARRAERERIAREMHDVLGHRISLASVHAGALAYRMAQADSGRGEPLDPAEVRRAVGVINDTVRLAMVELSEVLAVLRSEENMVADRPQPGLADLDTLVAEAVAAGQRVTLHVELFADSAPASGGESLESVATRLRPSVQRTVYRVVQEGLTNARKHAPDAPVAVAVRTVPDDGLLVTVSNPVASPSTMAPGARSGLAGLSERVALDGGTLEHGVVNGAFRLVVRLPWRS